MLHKSSGFEGVRWSRRLSWGGVCGYLRSCGRKLDRGEEGLHVEKRDGDGDVTEFPYEDEDVDGTCWWMSWSLEVVGDPATCDAGLGLE